MGCHPPLPEEILFDPPLRHNVFIVRLSIILLQPTGPLCELEPSSLATTTTLPASSNTGPPLLPGPVAALTVPVVTLNLCRGLFHCKANYCGDHSDRKQNPVKLHRGRR